MHINHRRKNYYTRERPRYHVSLKWYKRHEAAQRRAYERECIDNERWDDLPTRYPKSILWDAL